MDSTRAWAHRVAAAATATGPGRQPSLLENLPAHEAQIEAAVLHFQALPGEQVLSHAAEWLLDNFYLAQQSLRQVREDLPPGFYRQLPKLTDGVLAGYPRVYAIAQELVAADDARLDMQQVRRFVTCFQERQPLTTGEIWALPIMLRLSILAALAGAAAALTPAQAGPAQADARPDAPPIRQPGVSAQGETPSPTLSPTLSPALPLAHAPGADELVASCFTSLRAIATHDWRAFFEGVSHVEQTLRRDPAAIYQRMDRGTRDQYRGIVEKIALAAQQDEGAVAEAAVALAQESMAAAGSPARSNDADFGDFGGTREGSEKVQADDGWAGLALPRTAHVGYYLLGRGRAALEGRLGYRPGPVTSAGRWARRHPTTVYLGPILLLTALFVAGGVIYALRQDASFAQALLAAALLVLPALAAAVALVDWLITLVTPPDMLPKLEFAEEGRNSRIPDGCRTLVVIPALLTSEREVLSLLRQVEKHYLRNPQDNLYFGLLTDFADAPQQEMPADAALLEQAQAGIAALNGRYGTESQATRFCLFHRRRLWNGAEGAWIGWERKRGKLNELNRWLRGAEETSFMLTTAPRAQLAGVRYVITLDADTILGSEGAQRLIGALAHPLNQAVNDEVSGQVVEGYGLLQPRTEITPTSANHSLFTRIFAGDIGLDLYSHAVSNVYQDLFGSGIYIGKGIYDVDAFERSLEGRVPENALLSHDLFEGIHGRVGLVTDIVVYEDYPPSYAAYMRRQHRWTRGDWQLFPWLFPFLPGFRQGAVRTGFHAIDDWKMFDNLRRSLLAPGLLLLLLAGWLFLPGSPTVWTLAALGALAVPALSGAVTPWINRLRSGGAVKSGSSTASQSLASLRQGGLRTVLGVILLPYEAAQMLDAVTTSLSRMLFTHRNLLEWMTAAKAARFDDQGGSGRTWRQMAAAPVTAVAAGLLVVLLRPTSLPPALPLLLGWLLAPEIAFRLSKPIRRSIAPLSEQQVRLLRTLARRTWLFFEEFVGPEDHWLPPDHYQENLHGGASPYTSPTNIGMLLLSTLSAYDLGYLGVATYVARLRSTFETLARLERHRGHFFNWYDTRSLQPLDPRYVSTVDSGNLAACLAISAQSCRTIPHTRVLRWARWQGLADTFSLLDDFAAALDGSQKAADAQALRSLTAELRQRLLDAHDDPEGWMPALDGVAGEGWTRMEALLTRLVEENAGSADAAALHGLRVATRHISNDIFVLQRTVRLLLPWLPMLAEPPRLLAGESAGDQPLGEAVSQAWQALLAQLPANSSLAGLSTVCAAAGAPLTDLQAALAALHPEPAQRALLDEARTWCTLLQERLDAALRLAEELLDGLAEIERQAEGYFDEMGFGFLFDAQRQLFRIGYNVTSAAADNNFYDLLASEARIASLVALAKHEVPRSHWLHLGRPITQVQGTRALLSWSATMFEYLMPTLIMRSYPGTLLHESAVAAVDLQIAYAREKAGTWGISESGYYAFDPAQNYQYRAFGVPGLGFKRNLAEDLVIAPYASLLALPFQPSAVADNVAKFAALGALGVYGLYEAIDYTVARLPAGQTHALVQEYMAHHQGMILVALGNYLATPPATTEIDRQSRSDAQAAAADQPGNLMLRRFHADPRLDSVAVLLQERVPSDVPLQYAQIGELAPTRRVAPPVSATPWQPPLNAPAPSVHYLANGRYGLLITAAGGGLSRWQQFDLTRWRADTTLDQWGTWVYVQDRESGALWSATQQPVGAAPTHQSVRFYAHKAEFHRIDQAIAVTLEVTVAPDHDVEMRRVTVHNQDSRPRRLAVSSYGEVVMAPAGGDARHQAFNKLFIESEPLPGGDGLVFRRRLRAEDEPPVWLTHRVVGVGNAPAGGHGYESDRARFLGRSTEERQAGGMRAPAALEHPNGGLSGTAGATLDPIFCLTREIDLEPGESAQLVFLTAAAGSQARLAAATANYLSLPAVEHGFAQARSRAELELRQLGISTIELERYQALLGALLYPSPALRANAGVLGSNVRGQPGLWAFGISGDYPLLLVTIEDEDGLGLVQELVQAHRYWRRRGVQIDLAVLNERQAGYNQELRDQLQRLLVQMKSDIWLNRRGGIFLLHAGQLGTEDRGLLGSTARVVLAAGEQGLAAQLEPLLRQPEHLPAFVPERPAPMEAENEPAPDAAALSLAFANGIGGFSSDGREYVLELAAGQLPPAPWANVVANPDFGFLVSESGGGYTWAANSGENRLTPWANDPVLDTPGEVLYLRDEETSAVWSPTPLPCGAGAMRVRHGAGYTFFESESQGLAQQLGLYVAPDAPVKIVRLRLANQIDRPRRLTATFYVEWVLGVTREGAAQFIIPDYDDGSQALLARNPWHPEFGARVAFVAASRRLHGLTADRSEFLGRQGSLAQPAALGRIGLSGTVRAGLDPCAALQVHIDLPAGGSEEIWFVLGQGADREEAVTLARRFQEVEAVDGAWEATQGLWDDLLGAVQVKTPDAAMNLLLNRWLLYQSLSCRIWGRSAVYQSSGAFGFRDQLQDVMAMVHAAPHLARAQILNAAARQFEAGDVLHWWHPPSGRGVRTRCSDDLLWLPYVTAHYVEATGDAAILDEQIASLQGPPLAAGEDDRYGEYAHSTGKISLYEHCRRALKRGATAGAHGLPLIGSGDWNDGMNRVGIEGRGESVWLGWFLHSTLTRFALLCERRGDGGQAETYRQNAANLAAALEEHAWDGGWYRRAFYDDGTPLGSAQNRECQIDAIAQSWAVLSGAGDPQRSRQAMEAVRQRLVREEEGLLLLFTPPFDKTPHDPGYIKGYLPGIRENGGQYTHAATWSVWAFAALGDADTAERLFRLINPIYHADSAEKVQRYKVEPYVVAADIYGVPPHTGRGGWTWYTGSAAWFYRLGLEGLLGLTRHGDSLRIAPNLPSHWPGYEVNYRFGAACYCIHVRRAAAGESAGARALDGAALAGDLLPLRDDGGTHTVEIVVA